MTWSVKSLLLGGLALSAVCVPAGAAWAEGAPVPSETRVISGAKVDLWLPPTGAGPFPLALFSHGVSGCRNQSAYFMAALARAGMFVAAPDHADQRCGQTLDVSSLPPKFYVPDSWNDDTYADRRDQLRELRGTLLADPTLGSKIDPGKLALVGHSLGGYTVLGLAGARPGASLAGLRAVVALAPYLLPYATGGAPKAITVPVLIEAGAADVASANLGDFLLELGGPACQQVFPLANHFAWVDSPDLPPKAAQPEYQSPTAAAAVAFIERAMSDGTAEEPAASVPAAQVKCK